ncbi:MAG: hypothetical protein HY543_06185 [Deltaproteobacteria bacterium]|nr:hypothetical protein [Deltaproteobacteria bacterium]
MTPPTSPASNGSGAATNIFNGAAIRADLAARFEDYPDTRSQVLSDTYTGTIPGPRCFAVVGASEDPTNRVCFTRKRTPITIEIQARYNAAAAGTPEAARITQIIARFPSGGFGKSRFFLCDPLDATKVRLDPFPAAQRLKEEWCPSTTCPEAEKSDEKQIAAAYFLRKDPCEAPLAWECSAIWSLSVTQLVILPGSAEAPHLIASWRFRGRMVDLESVKTYLGMCAYQEPAKGKRARRYTAVFSDWIFPKEWRQNRTLPPTRAKAFAHYQRQVRHAPPGDAWPFFDTLLHLFAGRL